MKLDGIHHITAIANAAQNVDFYTRVMGLRMVKQSVNRDDPTVYHLPTATARPARPRPDLLRVPRRRSRSSRRGHGPSSCGGSGRPLPSTSGPSAWPARASRRSGPARPCASGSRGPRRAAGDRRSRRAPDGRAPGGALRACPSGLSRGACLHGGPERSRRLLEDALSFEAGEQGWQARGAARGATYAYDPPPGERGIQEPAPSITWRGPP